MPLNFKDRVSTYPNRYLVTPESGTAYYVTLERADSPTTAGTPLNAATLNQLVALADLEKLPDMHLWKRYESDPNTYIQTEVTDAQLGSKTSVTANYTALTYSSSFYIEDGALYLPDTNQTTHRNPTVDSVVALQGKYVRMNSTLVYYIPEDATFRETVTSGYGVTYRRLVVSSAIKYTIPQYYGYVMNEVEGTYPTNGVSANDGYWYVYERKWGECSGSVSTAQITAAVNDYLVANPPECDVSMNDVNTAIDSKIGSAIGGSY